MRTTPDSFTRLRLDGTPAVLPRPLDVLSERWFRTGPRLRLAVVAVVCIAIAAALTVRMTSSPWGPPVGVLVAATDLPVGHELGPGDVRAERWPSGVVPADAAADPVGKRMAVAAPAGSLLTERHVTSGGIAGALGPDTAAVAVPRDLFPALPAGALVDLVGAGHDGVGTVIVADVEVVRVDDDRVWVAVPRQKAAEVAGAAAAGQLTAVLLPR